MSDAHLPGGLPARPEGLALWREILNRPEDDLPRRIFADWMEDNGAPERADFVRAQLDRASLPVGDPGVEERCAREEEVRAAQGPSWEEEFPGPIRQGIEYRRGFAEVFTADADAFVRHAAPLARRTPLRGLRLRDFTAATNEAAEGARLRSFLATAQLDRLTLLDLKGVRIGHQGLEWVLNAPHLANLTELELGDNAVGPGALALVLRSWPGIHKLTALRWTAAGLAYGPLASFLDPGRSPALRTLDLSDNRLSDGQAGVLAQMPGLRRLKVLVLAGNAFTSAGVRALLPEQPWPELEYLNLAGNDLGAGGAEVLVRSGVLARLRALVLRGTDLGDRGVRVLAAGRAEKLAVLELGNNRISPVGLRDLAAAPFLPRLTTLSLEGNPLRGEGMTPLAGLPAFPHLRVLSLGRCRMSPEGFLPLLDSPLLGGLVRLNLRSTHLDDAAVGALVRSVPFVRLASLDLVNNELGPAGAEALAGCPHLARLHHLHLGRNAILARGASALAGSPYLSRLVTLGLSSNGIGDDGAKALAGSPRLANLTELNLVNNGIGDVGADALGSSPHLGRLTVLDLEGNRLSHTTVRALRGRFGGAVRV